MLSSSAVLIVSFFLLHWWGSVFMQTFFLHRYASHGMFRMSRGWERTFHLLTYIFQGSSYLTPFGYAYLHRAHHAYSDTEKDPHTPHRFKNAFMMMWDTKNAYSDLVNRRIDPEQRFMGYTPQWPLIDKIGEHDLSRFLWGTAYTLFYIAFAPNAWWFLLLPIHYFMGPIHGAIVNWCGHKYGYRNFNTRDKSRNVFVWDLVTLGECFQNNHHRRGQAPNFAMRDLEWDPTYWGICLFSALGIVDLSKKAQIQEWDEAEEVDDKPVAVPVPAAVAQSSATL